MARQKPNSLTIAACMAVFILPACPQFAAAQSTSRGIHSDSVVGGAVLLKTSQRVIEGRVVPSGDALTVHMSEDAKVQLPLDSVEHVAADKRAIYEYKAKGKDSSQWRAGDDFKLTRWCLSNEMYLEATEHYQRVAKFNRDHPRVKQLALELRSKLLSNPGFRQHLGLPPEPSQIAAQSAGKNAGSQSETGSVRPAGVDFSVTTMHPEIAGHFSRRIQPILMNRCSQAACHGGQSANGLRILEPYRSAYERVTTENLRSVLGQVSSRPETLAPLLTYATTAHGIQRQAAISVTETQLLSELTTWVRFVQNPVTTAVASPLVGQQPGGASVITPETQGMVPYQTAVRLMPVQPGASGLRPVPGGRAGASGLATNNGVAGGYQEPFPGQDRPLQSEIDELDRQLRQILGEAPANPATAAPTSKPVAPNQSDPFDPQVFNRQRG
ncbi:MAG: hypothetical protein AAGG44_05180 [Planctomycetota bacterium]